MVCGFRFAAWAWREPVIGWTGSVSNPRSPSSASGTSAPPRRRRPGRARRGGMGPCGRRRARTGDGPAASGVLALPGCGAVESRRGDVVEGAAGPGAELCSPEDRRDDAAGHQDLHLAPLGLCGHRRRAGLDGRAAGGGQGEPGSRHALVHPVTGCRVSGGVDNSISGGRRGGAGHGRRHRMRARQGGEQHARQTKTATRGGGLGRRVVSPCQRAGPAHGRRTGFSQDLSHRQEPQLNDSIPPSGAGLGAGPRGGGV